LIQACIERGADIIPGLVDMLPSPGDETVWLEVDPRWFRQVHAGHLLIHFQAREAASNFKEILSNPEHDTLLEWFDTDLQALGPDFIPMFLEVLQDDAANEYGRGLSSGALAQLAREHPEEREPIVQALRDELPDLNPDGTFDVDNAQRRDNFWHWTSVIFDLAELQDEASRDCIEAMFDANLVDTGYGSYEDYTKVMDGTRDPMNYSFDVVDTYRGVSSDDRTFTSDPAPGPRLLELLHRAGRYPEPELIRLCVEYEDAVRPHLVEAFREGVQALDSEAYWDQEATNWYRMIHAGKLLIHIQAEEVIPDFATAFANPRDQNFKEWFSGVLHHFGPPAVPTLVDVLEDSNADVWGRTAAASELGHIAAFHPEVQDRVLSALRSVLPTVGEDGAPHESSLSLDDGEVLWSNVAYELARHGDDESRPHIEALFEADLLDPMVFGDVDDYRSIVEGEGDAWTEYEDDAYDVVQDYTRWYEKGQREARQEELQKQREEREQQATKGGHHEGGTFVRDEPKVGRNDPCPCGSGAKYKYCCG
jgi:HEAT repeat protein